MPHTQCLKGPTRARLPAWPPRTALPRAMRVATFIAICLAGLALLAPPPLHAQNNGVAPGEEGDPAQDIIVEGLGFSKLILALEADANLTDKDEFRTAAPLLEQDLCWSGVFNLTGGQSRYCQIKGKPQRIDMRLHASLEGGAMMLRLYDTGPENLLLFAEGLPMADLAKVREDRVPMMALINRLTARITGHEGLLGSSIGFVLRQPGFAKVIVTTSTHGDKLRLLSSNRDINILPRFRPGGVGLVYTILGRKGTQVFYQSLDPKGNGSVESTFLTLPGSLNSGGAFSPDGMNLVFTMSVNHNADLFILNLQDKKPRQLTNRQGIETQAHWSPDGKSLLFVSDRSGTPQIYLLDMDTNDELRLTFESTYNADPKWSPDGKRILFTRRVNMIDQIHIMDRFGENVRMVTRGRYFSEQAEWSPDGRQVVFASNRTGEYKLYIVSTDGTNLRRLTRTPKRFEENSPTWTSRHLVR